MGCCPLTGFNQIYSSYYKLPGRTNPERLEYFITDHVSDICVHYEMHLFNSKRQKGFAYMMVYTLCKCNVFFSPCIY